MRSSRWFMFTAAATLGCGAASNEPTFSSTSVSASGTATGAGESQDGSASGDGDSAGDGDTASGDGDGTTTGDTTSGDGDGTSGDGTSGDGTSGDGTTGDGDGTSGDGTTGDGTTGDGDGTTGDGTTGDGTTGDGTTGDGDGDGEMGCNKVDLLFVIDDSGSMSDQQDKLTQAFPGFMATIDQQLVVNQGIDYRVGVLSTDMAGPTMCVFQFICGQGHRGRLQHGPDRLNCSDVPAGRWIETGPVQQVSDEFTCIASMNGGEFSEMPFEAMRAGLVDRVIDAEAYNAGFLRDDALLVVVFVTDEDDQSVMQVAETWPLILGPGPASPVVDYWNDLVALKGGEPARIVAVALSGDRTQDCPDPGGGDPIAVAAPRIHAFLDLAAPNNYWGDICADPFDVPLQEALAVIDASCTTFPQPQ